MESFRKVLYWKGSDGFKRLAHFCICGENDLRFFNTQFVGKINALRPESYWASADWKVETFWGSDLMPQKCKSQKVKNNFQGNLKMYSRYHFEMRLLSSARSGDPSQK